MRTIVIGDIHGCGDALTRLLSRLQPDEGADRMILLGDILDRGPDSRTVWRTVMALRNAFGERFVLLRGNHESYWMERELSLSRELLHLRVGKAATLRSFRRHRGEIRNCIDWLSANSVYFYAEDRFQCAHAGVMVEPIEANDVHTLLHDHALVSMNQYRGKLTITGHIGLPQAVWFAGDGETTEVLSPYKPYPLPASGVICIDTGCGKGGRLTGMVIENDTFTLIQDDD